MCENDPQSHLLCYDGHVCLPIYWVSVLKTASLRDTQQVLFLVVKKHHIIFLKPKLFDLKG